jgi:hypothetical protein
MQALAEKSADPKKKKKGLKFGGGTSEDRGDRGQESQA